MSVLLITISTLANWVVITPTVDEAACLKTRPAVVKQYEARFPYKYHALYIDSFCVSGEVVMPVNATDRALLVNISFDDNGKYTITPTKDKETCRQTGLELVKHLGNKRQMFFCWNGEVVTP